jgi:AAA15 family ATPase/GTPase
MLREYQLENFKAFAGPETMPIRPITLIYGPNSSGKSSILQSLLLLKQTLEEADNSTLLLPKGKLVDLGDYREFVHRHEASNQFSFKMFFTLDIEKVKPKWVKEILEATNSALVGLKVDFGYDEKIKSLNFSLSIFLEDKFALLISYKPPRRLSNGIVMTPSDINLEHGFWRTWWSGMKQYIENALDDDVDWVYYGKRKFGSGGEDLLRDIKDYSFEKAIEHLQDRNADYHVNYQHFLPVSRSAESEEFETQMWRVLLEAIEQIPPSRDSMDTKPTEEKVVENYSPFEAEIFYQATSEREPFRQGLDVSPLTFHICSAFRQLVEKMVYIGPLRSYPERYYTFSGNLSEQVGQYGEMLPDVLFQDHVQNHDEISKRVNAEFERFQLGYELKLSVLKDEDSNHSNVFALRVVDKRTGVSASIRDVGFGVSQVLPIIVQSLLSQNKTLLIEQPEIHLHPALQAELGDLFIKSALGEQKNTFILETHSEHLLLRIMRRMRETFQGHLPDGVPPVRPEDVAVLYVERDGQQSIVREMPLNERGELVKAWPGGFFEEGLREVLPTYDH